MKRIYIFGMLAMLGGCQSVNKALEYIPTVYQVKMDDETYRVFEHPKGDRLMTTSSISRSAAAGAAKGVTLGIANAFTPEQRHEAAARRHLDQTGRAHCQITRGYLLIEPQYEFFFECAAGDSAPKPTPKPV